MAVEFIGNPSGSNIWDIRCKAADTKPTKGPDGATNLETGSTIREFDTGKLWEYSAANTNPATTNGWWEVV
jgi:hypothetical protein